MSVILQSDQESLEFRKIALIFAMETICRAGRDTDAENGLVMSFYNKLVNSK